VIAVLTGYLAVLALWPGVRDHVPAALRWFGEPNSWLTIAIVVAALAALGAMLSRSHGARRPGAPIAIVVGLVLISAGLGAASYWRCHDDSNPVFFTPLIWTAALVKGGDPERSLRVGAPACPSPTPVALDIAELCALAAVFLSVIGVAVALFQSRLDRLRVYFAHSVTAVVDLDDDAISMVSAIAHTLDRRSTLVVITSDPDRACVREARTAGARVITIDYTRPQALRALPVWHKLDRIYLLATDPSVNLQRLATITDAVAKARDQQRIPLIVRIDDPWQASTWRAAHFGGSNTQWAADTVGRYEVTARRLLDAVTADPAIERVLLCGTSQLTLALCAGLAQRQLEADYEADDVAKAPAVTLIAEDAEEFRHDHRHSRTQLGLPADLPPIQALAKEPSVRTVSELLGDALRTAVIAVDADVDATFGTRLAARFPNAPIYAWDPNAGNAADGFSLIGRLRTYRLSLDLPGGQAQDNWERAARLIHDRYVARVTPPTAASLPWSELDEFYRGSNRRQVRNALWMVERIGRHTWNTLGSPDALTPAQLRGLKPLEQLRLMGFDRVTSLAMAKAEHEDWRRYCKEAGWRYGLVRDENRKIHDKLQDWATIEADPNRLEASLDSLAATLTGLHELGYRSRPANGEPDDAGWRRFHRTGTVIARKRDQPWSWTTRSGDTLHAQAGDWELRDADGDDRWSVRDDIFRASYEHLDGERWQSRGSVRARPAHDGEVVDTLEGPVTAPAGGWVVWGEAGDRWAVPADEFARRYAESD
jgi:hypothetical protein